MKPEEADKFLTRNSINGLLVSRHTDSLIECVIWGRDRDTLPPRWSSSARRTRELEQRIYKIFPGTKMEVLGNNAVKIFLRGAPVHSFIATWNGSKGGFPLLMCKIALRVALDRLEWEHKQRERIRLEKANDRSIFVRSDDHGNSPIVGEIPRQTANSVVLGNSETAAEAGGEGRGPVDKVSDGDVSDVGNDSGGVDRIDPAGSHKEVTNEET